MYSRHPKEQYPILKNPIVQLNAPIVNDFFKAHVNDQSEIIVELKRPKL